MPCLRGTVAQSAKRAADLAQESDAHVATGHLSQSVVRGGSRCEDGRLVSECAGVGDGVVEPAGGSVSEPAGGAQGRDQDGKVVVGGGEPGERDLVVRAAGGCRRGGGEVVGGGPLCQPGVRQIGRPIR